MMEPAASHWALARAECSHGSDFRFKPQSGLRCQTAKTQIEAWKKSLSSRNGVEASPEKGI